MLGVDSLALPFTKRTLANGLDVVVHEDHHVPIVAVNIWYHVGSKDERPGRTLAKGLNITTPTFLSI